MRKSIYQLSSAFVFILTLCHGEKEWDSFVLSLTWPVTLCKFSKLYNKDHPKCVVPAMMWEIHGLWPSFSSGGRSPEKCKISHKFRKEEIKGILSKLEKYWPDQFPGKNKYQFWEHEWEKHGRCATVVKATESELKYFNRTIALRQQFDVDRMLSSAGVKPGKSYKMSNVTEAVSRKTGARPRVLCGVSKHIAWISQLHICMDRNFKVTNCPAPKSSFQANSSNETKGKLPPSDLCSDMVLYPIKN